MADTLFMSVSTDSFVTNQSQQSELRLFQWPLLWEPECQLPLIAQSGFIKWIRDRIGLQQEEYVWASGLNERLVSEGIFAHRAVAFEMQREPLMARH